MEDVFVCKGFMPAVAVTLWQTVQRLSYKQGVLFNIGDSYGNEEALSQTV
jgi:hypothetical protein